MVLTLYWSLGSQPSRALKSLLVAGDVQHEEKQINILTGEHKSPEILELNPRG